MTEKRFKGFTSSIDYYIVEDTLENRYLSKKDVINALNKFWIQYEHYEKENKQLKQRINELELLNDGLNYALKYIKKIDVEIEVNDDGDVEWLKSDLF